MMVRKARVNFITLMPQDFIAQPFDTVKRPMRFGLSAGNISVPAAE